MKYIILVNYYERLERTTKKLEKRDILTDLYTNCSDDDLPKVVLLSMGIIYPQGEFDLGVAREMMKSIIRKVAGISEKELTKKFKETGDLGLTAAYFIKNKKQQTLGKKELTVEKIFENLRKLPEIAGKGSQEKKMDLIAELLSSATAREACYIVRTTLGDMRVGVAGGIVRDAIAKAFGKEPKAVENMYNVIGDYGTVAELVKKGKMNAKIIVGRPIRVMLADRAKNLSEALDKFDNPAIEFKYDGFRIAAHKSGNNVKIFSRRLEDVTKQFPDIRRFILDYVKANDCIIEGEAVAVDTTGYSLPFQVLSRRIQRKYDIDKMVKEIPVQVNLFDILYLNKTNLMNEPLCKRWNKLKNIIKQTSKFRLADHIETKNFKEADDFYKKALTQAQEGVIVKNLDAKYQPGKRVGYWLKCKPIMEPLDLVIVGAEWGEGKRAKWLGSLILAAKKGNEFLQTGRMASGLTEQQMKELTKKLKKIITEEHGKIVKIKPEVVIEVGYEEIQKSPKYPSGYALRFPRLLRIRSGEKNPEDANTVKDIEKLFLQQKNC